MQRPFILSQLTAVHAVNESGMTLTRSAINHKTKLSKAWDFAIHRCYTITLFAPNCLYRARFGLLRLARGQMVNLINAKEITQSDFFLVGSAGPRRPALAQGSRRESVAPGVCGSPIPLFLFLVFRFFPFLLFDFL